MSLGVKAQAKLTQLLLNRCHYLFVCRLFFRGNENVNCYAVQGKYGDGGLNEENGK